MDEPLDEEKLAALQGKLEKSMTIDFIVGPPKAPWQNGLCKSLIGQFKKIFKQIVPRAP